MIVAEDAPAKVNFSLRITGRRADGYHFVDSLVAFASVGDRVAAEEADSLTMEVDGPFAADLANVADNIVLRAARALAAHAKVEPRARLRLTKNLPVASGIGGGSADAAAAIRALVRLWRIDLRLDGLRALATGIGADVPVCLASAPAHMAGVGEVLTDRPPMPPVGIVLVNPGVAVPTADVFGGRTGAFSPADALGDGHWADAAELAADLAGTGNDLEPAAIALCPHVADALGALRSDPACLLARMSGSGATCYGLLVDAATAEDAAARLARPGWWTWGGGLYHPAPDSLSLSSGQWGVAKR